MRSSLLLIFITLMLCSCDPALYMTIENTTNHEVAIEFMFEEPNSFWPKQAKDGDYIYQVKLKTELCCRQKELSFGIGDWMTEDNLKSLTTGLSAIKIIGSSTYLIEEDDAIRQFFEAGITNNPSHIRIGIR